MHDAFHVPPWLWGVALAVVLAVVAADVLLASRSRGHEPGLREAALCTAGVVALGALFGLSLAAAAGPKAAGQFYAGWLTEYSLSLDNLFVFVLLIGRAGIPGRLRSRVLLAGIGLALLLRAVFIAAGAAALNRFDWVLYIFGGVLLVTAVRMAAGRGGPPDPAAAGPGLPGPKALRGGIAGRLKRHRHGAMLALIATIAAADVVFAMDSIPAVFGLTRDPFLVLAANVFALLGLRHLYFLIGGLLDRLVHLTAGLSAILAFIGMKLIFEALADSGVHRVGPVPVPHIGTGVSLCVIGGVLAVVTVSSLVATRHRRDDRQPRRELSSRSGRAAERPPRPVRPSESHQ
jgi:tellurite resistance protein TerC